MGLPLLSDINVTLKEQIEPTAAANPITTLEAPTTFGVTVSTRWLASDEAAFCMSRFECVGGVGWGAGRKVAVGC